MSTTSKLSRENLRVQIVTLREQGLSLKDIEKKTGKHRFTISRICKSVQKTNSFKEKPRSGRPTLLDDRQKRILARILRLSKVKTAEHVRKEAKQFHNIDVSRDSRPSTEIDGIRRQSEEKEANAFRKAKKSAFRMGKSTRQMDQR
jgi:transposase